MVVDTLLEVDQLFFQSRCFFIVFGHLADDLAKVIANAAFGLLNICVEIELSNVLYTPEHKFNLVVHSRMSPLGHVVVVLIIMSKIFQPFLISEVHEDSSERVRLFVQEISDFPLSISLLLLSVLSLVLLILLAKQVGLCFYFSLSVQLRFPLIPWRTRSSEFISRVNFSIGKHNYFSAEGLLAL